MKKIISNRILGLLIFLPFVLFGFNVQAQSNPSDLNQNPTEISDAELEKMQKDFLNETIENSENLILLATINIYETEILKQENNKFDLSFLITNREKAQPSIKYAIQLVFENKEGDETILDEKVYTDVLNLGENSEIRKQIKYEAPKYLKGNYFLRIVSKTEGGLILGTNSFGEISLNGDAKYIEVLNPTCFLSVGGEDQNKKYDLYQGVDVNSDEVLKLNCEVQNHSNEDVVLSYFSNNFHRSVFGDKSDLIETYKNITEIKSKEKKNISIEISKEEKPQAYDTIVYFKTDKNIPANSITTHYVLRGKSASIVNLLLNKNFYSEGDSAEISFFYAGSADNFPQSRLGSTSIEKIVSKFKIKDKENKLCGPEISSELDQNKHDNNFKYQIDKFCASPSVEAVLVDGVTGEVLAKGSFGFTSPEEFIEKPTKIADKLNVSFTLLLIIAGLPILLISLLLLIKKKKKLILKVLIIFFFSGFCFLNEVRAESYYLSYKVKAGGGDANFVDHSFTFNYSLNETTYSPGEKITAEIWMTDIACWNSITAGVGLIAFPYNVQDISRSTYYKKESGKSSIKLTGDAPSTPGKYKAVFNWVDDRYMYAKYIPTSGTWYDGVYFNNKAYALNLAGYVGVYSPNVGRRWTWDDKTTAQELKAYGFPTAKSHYDAYGKAEGTSPYLVAGDFSGSDPSILKTIDFTVSAPACSPNCDEKTSYCSGIKFADSCGTADACTGTKTDGACASCGGSAETARSVSVTGSTSGTVWGSGPYTTDSNLATAAVHAGLVSPGSTATIDIAPAGCPSSFSGSTRNGVTTSSYSTPWYAMDLSLGAAPASACSGSVPGGSTKCPGDNTTSSSASWHSVGALATSCTAAECEYYTPCVPSCSCVSGSCALSDCGSSVPGYAVDPCGVADCTGTSCPSTSCPPCPSGNWREVAP